MKMGDKLKAQLNKFKYPLLALVLGLIIMLLPIGESSSRSISSQTDEQRLATVRMMPLCGCRSSRLLKLSRAFQATVFR